MPKAKRIFFIADTKDMTDKFLLAGLRRQVKGFIRLGHDTQVFSYGNVFKQVGPLMGLKPMRRVCKTRVVDPLMAKQIRLYNPDIVHFSFANFLNAETVKLARSAAPDAVFIGADGDLWPELHRYRVAAAKELDFVMTTFAGKGMAAYHQAGVKCVFIPNMCDPDTDYRYDVGDEWKCNMLFTGKTRLEHKRYPTDDLRCRLIRKVEAMDNSAIYGCLGGPRVSGIHYLYAISGAKMALSVNAVNDIRLYHSDRMTHYLAGGTCVLARNVPDSQLLFKDGVHLRYFETVEEFAELANWYLDHEDERLRIANAGMQYVHAEFNCLKIAKYIMDVIEKGSYEAPWMV